MSRIVHSLIWAAAILGAAVVSNVSGLSDSASWGVILGLSGAAIASLGSGSSCGTFTGCAQ